MKTGPKFKIARRLGAPIFEKTQGAKFAQSLQRKEKSGKVPSRPKSEFGRQLIEKQKARFSYGISEKQFARYIKSSLTASEPTQKVFQTLESRLDNALYRAGFAKTRAQARQMAAHGHATVNGRRVTIPSISLKVGDRIGVREGSMTSPLGDVTSRMSENPVPEWLKVDPNAKTATVEGMPVYAPAEQLFDLNAVIEFYSR